LASQPAPSDSARQELLLDQARTRLDEATRLLAQGREQDAAAVAERYDRTLAAATAASKPSDAVETRLQVNETRLTQLVQTAPPAARPGLEMALQATRRNLARGLQRPDPALLQPTATPVLATPTDAVITRELAPAPTRTSGAPPARAPESQSDRPEMHS